MRSRALGTPGTRCKHPKTRDQQRHLIAAGAATKVQTVPSANQEPNLARPSAGRRRKKEYKSACRRSATIFRSQPQIIREPVLAPRERNPEAA